MFLLDMSKQRSKAEITFPTRTPKLPLLLANFLPIHSYYFELYIIIFQIIIDIDLKYSNSKIYYIFIMTKIIYKSILWKLLHILSCYGVSSSSALASLLGYYGSTELPLKNSLFCLQLF